MLSSKTKGLFVEINDFSILAAVTSALEPPFTIEALREYPVDMDPERVREALADEVGLKARGYAQGHCGIYPHSRFIRRTTLENPAKARDPGYFGELLSTQFRIDPTSSMAAVIMAGTGDSFSTEKPLQAQKELVLCGASKKDMTAQQQRAVSFGVYPVSLQLGTVAVAGGILDYIRWKEINLPTLVLEISPESSNLFIISDEMLDITRPIPYGLNVMFPLIQQELGLKDEESAKKLFYSNTFDFTEMGPALLRKMLKELQASTGFYEVQTGQTIGQIFLSLLPKNLSWIQQVLSRSLGVKVLTPEYGPWLKDREITLGPAIQPESLDNRWIGLFSLMGDYTRVPEPNGEKK